MSYSGADRRSHEENSSELCSAGKLLEARLRICTDNLVEATKSIQFSCADIAKSCKDLRDFSIRDQEKIENLENARRCKEKKIEIMQEDAKEHEVAFAAHLGEHLATKKLEGSTGRRWGLLSGLSGGAILEFLRYMVTGRWG